MLLPRPLLHLVFVVGFGLVATAAFAVTIVDDDDYAYDSTGTSLNDFFYLDLANDYPSVGQFAWREGRTSYLASGVLIAPQWVLTAGHVVDGAHWLEFSINGETYRSRKTYVHPDWNGDVLNGYDIGLVKLAAEVVGVEPAVRFDPDEFDLDQMELAGEKLLGTSVGFGMTGTGRTGAVRYDQLERAGNNVIDAWLPDDRIFFSDFDNPGSEDVPSDGDNLTGDSGLTQQYVPGSSTPPGLECLIAPGDSGGGVFYDLVDAGVWQEGDPLNVLIGIHSFIGTLDNPPSGEQHVFGQYRDFSGHTFVGAFDSWIDEVLSSGNPGKGGGNGKDKGGEGSDWASGFSDFTVVMPVAVSVPEPATMSLLSIAALCALAYRARRRRQGEVSEPVRRCP